MKGYIFFIFITVGLLASACKNAVKTETTPAVQTEVVPVPQNISTADFEAGMNKRNIVILDVRSPEEIAEGHIKGAIFANFYDDDFMSQISGLEKNKTYYIYCKSGGRSGQACDQFVDSGFSNVYNLEGGFDKWNSEGREIIIPN